MSNSDMSEFEQRIKNRGDGEPGFAGVGDPVLPHEQPTIGDPEAQGRWSKRAGRSKPVPPPAVISPPPMDPTLAVLQEIRDEMRRGRVGGAGPVAGPIETKDHMAPTPEQAYLSFVNELDDLAVDRDGNPREIALLLPPASVMPNYTPADIEKVSTRPVGLEFAKAVEGQETLYKAMFRLHNARVRKENMYTPQQAEMLPELLNFSRAELEMLMRLRGFHEASCGWIAMIRNPQLTRDAGLPDLMSIAKNNDGREQARQFRDFRQAFRNLLHVRLGITPMQARLVEQNAFNFVAVTNIVDSTVAQAETEKDEKARIGGLFGPAAVKAVMNLRGTIVKAAIDTNVRKGQKIGKRWPDGDHTLSNWATAHSRELENGKEFGVPSKLLFVSALEEPVWGMADEGTITLDHFVTNGERFLRGQINVAPRPVWMDKIGGQPLMYYELRRMGGIKLLVEVINTGEMPKGKTDVALRNVYEWFGIPREMQWMIARIVFVKTGGSGGQVSPKNDDFVLDWERRVRASSRMRFSSPTVLGFHDWAVREGLVIE